jgi:hypothetical protein
VIRKEIAKKRKSYAAKNNRKTTNFNEWEKNEKTARLLTVAAFNDCQVLI